MATVLLPRIFPKGFIQLGAITKSPLRRRASLLNPSKKTLKNLFGLYANESNHRISNLFLPVERHGRFSPQLMRLLNSQSHPVSDTLLLLQGGETTYKSFNDSTKAWQTVFTETETRKWVNEQAKQGCEKVYFIVGVEDIKGAEVKRVEVETAGQNGWMEIPLHQLPKMSSKLCSVSDLDEGTKIDWSEFGIMDLDNVDGTVGVEYYEVRISIKSRPKAVEGEHHRFHSEQMEWDLPVEHGGLDRIIRGEPNLIIEAELGGWPNFRELARLGREGGLKDEEAVGEIGLW